jgi:hypothetical protein
MVLLLGIFSVLWAEGSLSRSLFVGEGQGEGAFECGLSNAEGRLKQFFFDIPQSAFRNQQLPPILTFSYEVERVPWPAPAP